MIKLLVVDDEFVVRQGIRQAIPWDKFGISVAGDAGNAKEAIKLAKQLNPDIILCDIRMPGEDGFYVINTLKETMPDVEFILISGYDDQEYMLNAIRHGVCDYLLKPLNMLDIQQAVLKVCRKIHRRKEEEQAALERNKLLLDNLDTLRSHFIEKLLHGKIAPEQLKQNISSLGLSLKGPSYMLLLAKGNTEHIHDLIQDFAFIFREYSPTISSLQKYNNLVAVILNVSCKPVTQQFSFITKTFLANSKSLEGIVAVSPLCNSIFDLSLYLPKLIDLTERGFWYPKGCFCFLDSEFLPSFPKERVQKLERQLIDSIRDGKSDKIIKQQFDELISVICESRPVMSVFKEEMNYLFQAIHGVLGDESSEYTYNFTSVSEVQQQFSKLCNLPNVLQNKYRSGLVGKALQYIGLHYCEDISLEQAAGELYISPTYLSHILKEKTNWSFLEWIHYFRIEKAKELLVSTDYSINKIAELCGYNSYKLLSEHFRKLTGLTATEYRAKNSELHESSLR